MAKRIIKTLAVEDNPLDMELLREKLSRSKRNIFNITVVKDLLGAFSALEKDSYEIILLDLFLPDSSGIESYDKIKKKAGHVPVIILTVNKDDELAEQAAQHGVQDYFVKGNYELDVLERSITYSIERKRQEKLLKESEEKYKNIFNYAEVGIFRSKIDGGGMIDFNKKMENILEYTRNELLEMPSKKLWVDDKLRDKMLVELKRNRVVNDYEAEFITKNRRIRAVLLSMRLFEKEGFIEGTIADITKLKQAREELAESEDHFRSVFEQAAVGMAFMNMDGKFIKVNKRYCEILGYTNEELEGMTIEDVLRPEDIENDRMIMKLLIGGEVKVLRTEKQHVRKNKLLTWTDLSVSLARNPDNSPKYFVAVIEDITEKKEAEERWAAFTDAADDSLMLLDKDLNLAAANSAAYKEYEKITGKKMEPGWPALDLVRDLKSTSRYKKFRDVVKTGRTLFINEYEVNLDGHEPRYYSLKAFKVGNGMGLIITDITELRQSEIILKKSYEKLKEVDRLKSNFISIISHELRTPLTIIKGFISFLVKDAAGALNDIQKNFVNTIDLNVTRLGNIINDMVDISRIERGTFTIERESRDLIGILNEAIDSMRCIIEEKGISLERDFELNSAVLHIDKGRMMQAITNLINNAARFSRKGDSVVVSLARADKCRLPAWIRERIAEEKECYYLSVKDQGAGIEKKYLEKVFERFFQVEDADVRKHQGAGLGLSIAKNIVEAHGGFIWAESEGLGKGSKICMVLPE